MAAIHRLEAVLEEELTVELNVLMGNGKMHMIEYLG
jgi:hypothetical protein